MAAGLAVAGVVIVVVVVIVAVVVSKKQTQKNAIHPETCVAVQVAGDAEQLPRAPAGTKSRVVVAGAADVSV